MLLGVLSVACIPAAIAVAHYSAVDLIQAGYAVPLAFALGVLAILLARFARRRSERTIGRVGGTGTSRLARVLGAVGIYFAGAGALALGVYALLQYLSA